MMLLQSQSTGRIVGVRNPRAGSSASPAKHQPRLANVQEAACTCAYVCKQCHNSVGHGPTVHGRLRCVWCGAAVPRSANRRISNDHLDMSDILGPPSPSNQPLTPDSPGAGRRRYERCACCGGNHHHQEPDSPGSREGTPTGKSRPSQQQRPASFVGRSPEQRPPGALPQLWAQPRQPGTSPEPQRPKSRAAGYSSAPDLHALARPQPKTAPGATGALEGADPRLADVLGRLTHANESLMEGLGTLNDKVLSLEQRVADAAALRPASVPARIPPPRASDLPLADLSRSATEAFRGLAEVEARAAAAVEHLEGFARRAASRAASQPPPPEPLSRGFPGAADDEQRAARARFAALEARMEAVENRPTVASVAGPSAPSAAAAARLAEEAAERVVAARVDALAAARAAVPAGIDSARARAIAEEAAERVFEAKLAALGGPDRLHAAALVDDAIAEARAREAAEAAAERAVAAQLEARVAEAVARHAAGSGRSAAEASRRSSLPPIAAGHAADVDRIVRERMAELRDNLESLAEEDRVRWGQMQRRLEHQGVRYREMYQVVEGLRNQGQAMEEREKAIRAAMEELAARPARGPLPASASKRGSVPQLRLDGSPQQPEQPVRTNSLAAPSGSTRSGATAAVAAAMEGAIRSMAAHPSEPVPPMPALNDSLDGPLPPGQPGADEELPAFASRRPTATGRLAVAGDNEADQKVVDAQEAINELRDLVALRTADMEKRFEARAAELDKRVGGLREQRAQDRRDVKAAMQELHDAILTTAEHVDGLAGRQAGIDARQDSVEETIEKLTRSVLKQTDRVEQFDRALHRISEGGLRGGL